MTPRLATAANQAIVWRWEGEAFGESPPVPAHVTINLRFPGQYYDQETKLHYNWNRYYDPALGRYITSDPIGLDGGMNTYLYANANPARFVDLFGLMSRVPVAGAPSPLTCLKIGETCDKRTQRGILACMAARGAALATSCRHEWGAWFIDCGQNGGTKCKDLDPTASCPVQTPKQA